MRRRPVKPATPVRAGALSRTPPGPSTGPSVRRFTTARPGTRPARNRSARPGPRPSRGPGPGLPRTQAAELPALLVLLEPLLLEEPDVEPVFAESEELEPDVEPESEDEDPDDDPDEESPLLLDDDSEEPEDDELEFVELRLSFR